MFCFAVSRDQFLTQLESRFEGVLDEHEVYDILASEFNLLEQNFDDLESWYHNFFYKRLCKVLPAGCREKFMQTFKSMPALVPVKDEKKKEDWEMEFEMDFADCFPLPGGVTLTSPPLKSPMSPPPGQASFQSRSPSPVSDLLTGTIRPISPPVSWAKVVASQAKALPPPSPPPQSSKLPLKTTPPTGLATLQCVTPLYGLLAFHRGGGFAVFTAESKLDGGTLQVEDLSTIFRCGDLFMVEGASRFAARVRPDVPFCVRRMLWVCSGSPGASVAVSHGVMLSRFPESVIGVRGHGHVDAPATTFSLNPYGVPICSTVLVRYRPEPLADHGQEAINVVPLLPIKYEEEIVLVAISGQAMVAAASSGDVVLVPGNVLQYRHLSASEELLGRAYPALTCPILPYENPGTPEGTGLSVPDRRAHLLYV